ncbi:MAG TPA: hypothetical protein VFE96_09915 [Candidatus Bathyarchaeia archaeon]|nr:hypothetical protein [Candidatus Bathyarchaeia archaeon]
MSMTDQALEKRVLRPVSLGTSTQVLQNRMPLEEVVGLYKSIGRRNSEYFQWLHNVYNWTCMPCVSFDYRKILGEDKTKMMVWDILLDDLADNYDTRSQALLEEYLQIPWQNSLTKNDYLDTGARIWEDYIGSVVSYPRFREFERLFYLDLRQSLTSMVYSSLVNSLEFDSPLELNMYAAYGCMVMLAIDMDLMCSPTFDKKDLGRIRSVGVLAQRVTHIGNMLSTYPAELAERDLSSPIISMAVRKGLIERGEMGDPSALTRTRKLEDVFRKKAQSYIVRVAAIEKEISSVNIRGFSDFLGQLLNRFSDSTSLR